MRHPFGTSFWVYIVSSIALVLSVLSSPIRTPQSPNARVYANFLTRNFARVSNDSDSELVFSSATPRRASVDADDFKEKDEDELFSSFSDLVTPTFLPSYSSRKLLSSLRPGNSPPGTAAVPLRC